MYFILCTVYCVLCNGHCTLSVVAVVAGCGCVRVSIFHRHTTAQSFDEFAPNFEICLSKLENS